MEKRNLPVGEGLSKVIEKLPVGFRFLPTDEEIVVHYLRKKASWSISSPVSSVILELDVFQTDPWNLPGDQRENRYFFGRKTASRHNWGCERIRTDSGHWKTIGRTRRISAIMGNVRVDGVRRTLEFRNHRSCRSEGLVVPRWILHEISLAEKEEYGDWAVYRLFWKTARSSSKRAALPRPIATLSPCSSSITEIPCLADLDQEETSMPSCKIFRQD